MKIYRSKITAPILALPHCLDMNSIFELFKDDPKTYGERALWFISYIYHYGVYSHVNKNAPIPIHSRTLKFILGEKKLKSPHIKERQGIGGENNETITQYLFILHKLESNGIIEIIREYQVEEYPQSYRLLVRNIEDSYSAQQFYKLTSPVLIKKFSQLQINKRNEFSKKSKAHKIIHDSYLDIEYDAASAEMELIEKDRIYHNMLISGNLIWKQDEQNRIYTAITVIPKRLRRFIKWKDQSLYSVDVSSSQPVLHVLLYENESPEKEEYKALLEQGEFYQVMNSNLKTPYNFEALTKDESDEQKAILKARVFQEIFYGHPEKKERGELWEIFARLFPILAARITAVKGTGGAYKELPKTMQWIEAHIMLNGVVEEVGFDGPLITIHDCALTTLEHFSQLNELIKKCFWSVCNTKVRTKVNQIDNS